MGSLTANADLQIVFGRTRQHYLGMSYIKARKCKPGSGIRRPGTEGKEAWCNDLRGVGWSKERGDFVSVYCDASVETQVKELFEKEKKKIEEAGILDAIPTVVRETLDTLVTRWNVIDGGHRTEASVMLEDEAKEQDEKDKYIWVRASVYTSAVWDDSAALAKAINDKDNRHVPEDNLARITFMQKMLVRYYLQQTKDPDEDDVPSSSGVRRLPGVGEFEVPPDEFKEV